MTYPAGSTSSTRAVTTVPTSIFLYDFRADDESWVKVVVDGVTVDLGFSVVANPDGIGGTVTFTTPQPTGTEVVMLREVPVEQELDLVAKTRFSPAAIEAALDKLTMMIAANAKGVEDSLSRVNATDNEMYVDIDMNTHRIKNLLAGVDPDDAVSLSQMEQYVNILLAGSQPTSLEAIGDGIETRFAVPQFGGNIVPDLLVYVSGVFQSPRHYTPDNVSGEIVFDTAPADTAEIVFLGSRPKVTYIDGDIRIPVISETRTLDSGQLAVNFALDVSDASFLLHGVHVDDKNLILDVHYYYSGAKQITLLESYPRGTQISIGLPTSTKKSGGGGGAAVLVPTKNQNAEILVDANWDVSQLVLLTNAVSSDIKLGVAPIGTSAYFVSTTTANVKFTAETGQTFLSPAGDTPYTQYSTVTAICTDTDTWLLVGDVG